MSTGNFPSPQLAQSSHRRGLVPHSDTWRLPSPSHPTLAGWLYDQFRLCGARISPAQPSEALVSPHPFLVPRPLEGAFSNSPAHRELCRLGCRSERVPTTLTPGLNRGEARAAPRSVVRLFAHSSSSPPLSSSFISVSMRERSRCSSPILLMASSTSSLLSTSQRRAGAPTPSPAWPSC